MVACLESCIAHLVEDEGWIGSKPLAAIPASKVGNALTSNSGVIRSKRLVHSRSIHGKNVHQTWILNSELAQTGLNYKYRS